MKKLLFVVLFTGMILSNIAYADQIPSGRLYTWQGNVGIGYCKNTSYYTAATCTAAGSIWYSDIPTDRTQAGSTITASSGDRTTTIQNAINAAPSNTYVLLGPGSFSISSIYLKSHVTLRGSGKNITTLVGNTVNASDKPVVGFVANRAPTPTISSGVALASGYTAGSTSITTSSNHGWSAGDYILFNQTADSSGTPPVTGTANTIDSRLPAHLVRIVDVPTATSATLEVPLACTLNASKDPRGKKVTNISTAFTMGAGVEDLTIDTRAVYTTSFNAGVFYFGKANYCWMLKVEIDGFDRTAVYVESAYRGVVRSCELHNNLHSPRDPNYGYLWWGGIYWMSNMLVEDNYLYNSHGGFTNNGGTTANVFGYNYITDLWSESSAYSNTQGIFFHGHEPMFNLFEGTHNDGSTSGGDNDSGTNGGGSAYNTFFRNKLHGIHILTGDHPRYNQDVGYVLVGPRHVYHNLVGNILGHNDSCGSYDTTDLFSGSGVIYCWYDGSSGTATQTTFLRNANYDYYNDAQKNCSQTGETGYAEGSDCSTTLANSLYLSAQPSATWWCTESTWPPVNPAGANDAARYSKIPAQLRYEGGTCTLTEGGDTTAPTVTITTSDPQNIVSDSLYVYGTSEDIVGVTVCKYRIGAAPDNSSGVTTTGTTSWNATTTGYSQGANTLYVGCRDAAGNWGTDTITVNRDSVAPTVTITSPTSSATYGTSSSTITLGGTSSSDTASVAYSNAAGGSGSCTGTTSWTCSNITLTSGSGNVITVTGTDAFSNQGTDIITVTYTPPDTTPPSVTITTTDPTNTSLSTQEVAWNASDAVGVTSCKWRIGSAPDAFNGTTDGSSPATISGYAVGANTVYIGCTDAAGNWGSDSLTINYAPPGGSGCYIQGGKAQ